MKPLYKPRHQPYNRPAERIQAHVQIECGMLEQQVEQAIIDMRARDLPSKQMQELRDNLTLQYCQERCPQYGKCGYR